MNWYQKISTKSTPDWETLKKKGPKRNLMDWKEREYFINNYSWAVPTEEAIKKIKQFVAGRKVIEIGSGFGLWARFLQQHGVHITPTDNFSTHGTEIAKHNKEKMYTEVEDIEGEKAIEQYSDHSVLFLVWPLYDDPLAFNVLNKFKGSRVIFIGEGMGGCTGDDNFHNILNKEFNLVEEIDIPQWGGIHDYLSFWERKIAT